MRPLPRILGVAGPIPWRLVRVSPRARTWILLFDGELEDFYVC